MWRNLNLCLAKHRGYRGLMGGMFRGVLGPSLVCAAVLLAPSVAAAAPTGSVAGWRSPVLFDAETGLPGTMTLTVWANPDGVALVSATATLGGVAFPPPPAPPARFTNLNGCVGLCTAEALVKVDTALVPNGLQELVVTVLDANGERHRLQLSQNPLYIEVDKTEPVDPCEDTVRVNTCEVTVRLGSGQISQSPSSGGGATSESGPSCRAPRLSMRLADKPLRYRRGVPVLKRGRVYRYAGHLTCRINGARRPAPRGMAVQVRNRLRGGSTVAKPSIQVRKSGDIVARLAYRSSRTIVFRVRGVGGELVRVRIPIRVVR